MWAMIKVVKHLPSKHEALGLNIPNQKILKIKKIIIVKFCVCLQLFFKRRAKLKERRRL
jgi:hypothetical protein